ncbi:MAG: 1-phosphofructokinase family hexose kinase [Abitibacteriaceae bacterium]|nr:1-phosphofructokinase family hexose kinase [Abditibacteriaceae bacterium]MBV9866529.1 1-phosphofructokinase family hexose kinase [Abditibacteriaceae bacterium]
MLLTVTPNVCIERTVMIEDFAPGKVHRVPPQNLHVNAGGKGINAARVAAQLGCAVLATGWVGQRQMDWFAAQLKREGVPHDMVAVAADTRVCTNILNGTGTKTEIVEAGTPLDMIDGTRLLEKFEALLPQASLVAICGSYPPSAEGASDGFDAHLTSLTELARQNGKRVIVDGKGRAFEMVVRSQHPPWCIKPNLDEAAQLLHHPLTGEVAERTAVQEMLDFGVEVVLLSCGERGAYLGTAEGIRFFPAPLVREVSPVGSGDAMVGAFAAQFLATGNITEATRWGLAAGAANATQILSAFCNRADIEALLPPMA